MDATCINVVLALAVLLVPLILGGLLIEMKERHRRKSKNLPRGDVRDCGIIISHHPLDDH